MAVDLTSGAIPVLSNGDYQKMDLKPVFQVINILNHITKSEPAKEVYRLFLSDGSCHHEVMIAGKCKELVSSQQLQKGSIVQITEFVYKQIRNHHMILIINLKVIVSKCDIIGDPIQIICDKIRSVERPTPPSISEESHAGPNHETDPPASKQKPLTSETQRRKRKGQSRINNILSVAKEIAKMTKEKNEEDDMGACIEKLDKLDWGTQDPMYNAALLLFGESADYRKLWLHLKPECCGNWVTNAGSKFGLVGLSHCRCS